MSNRGHKYFDKPWVDAELTNDIRLKNIARSTKISIPTAINTEIFIKMRNQVTSKTRVKMKEYFADYLDTFKANSRKLWDGINTDMA